LSVSSKLADSAHAYATAFIDDRDELDLNQLGPDATRIGSHKLTAV
jgi:hypothetical protein